MKLPRSKKQKRHFFGKNNQSNMNAKMAYKMRLKNGLCLMKTKKTSRIEIEWEELDETLIVSIFSSKKE
jgi:hypothetical protein